MALTATYDTQTQKNYEVAGHQARGLQIVFGTIAATYSSAGGLAWTLPVNRRLFAIIPPVSQYIFAYNCTTSRFMAYEHVVTTTALASTLVEVASDTDFTSLSDSIRFVAFGY